MNRSPTHLLRGDRLLAGLAELLNSLVVVAQVLLATNENDRKTLAEVKDLGNPLQVGLVLAYGLSRA